MPRRIIYRKKLLQAIEAFLQGTSASIAQGQRIIEQCHSALRADSQRFTLNGLIWDSYFYPLTDSVYFMSQEYLRETRQILLRLSSSKERRKIFITYNFQPYLTVDEGEWYTQLLSMLDFIQGIPFAQIAKATVEARQRKIPGNVILDTIPEAMFIREVQEEYLQRKKAIGTIAANISPPEQFGEETIYRLVLREVTDLVTTIDIRLSAIYTGHPSPLPPYSRQGDDLREDDLDMSELLAWAKRALSALSGAGTLFLSWQLTKAISFNADLLLLSLY